MAKYLDENGLLYFWQQIKTKFAGNAFSKVRVTNSGTNTDLEADTISDTLTITNGNDITLTPTANTDTVQITHANSGVTAASKGDTTNQTPSFGGTFKVPSGTVNARGHLTAFADHTVTIPNAVASSSSAGLMSAADKTRLDNLDGEYIELPANPSNGNYLKYNGTAWVADDIPEGAAASSTTPKMDGTAAVGTENAFARGDHVHPTDTSRAPLASPTFTGTPKAPTASAGTNTTQIATTAFVKSALDSNFVVITGTVSNVNQVTIQKTPTEIYNYLNAGTSVYVKALYEGNDPYYPTSTVSIHRINSIKFEGNSGSQLYTIYVNLCPSYEPDNLSIYEGYGTGNVSDSSITFSVKGKLYATLESPTFTGTPKAPTPTAGDSSTKIATTAFVAGEISGKIDNPSTKTSGQFLKYDGTSWVADNAPAGTVTSVRVQATSPVSSSVSTAQTGTLNTTISLANGYGDTKNPYAAKAKNLVLAGPSSGSNAVPSFRALVADDIPTLTKSKISDFPVAGTDYVVPSTLNSYVTTTTAEATYAKKTDISGAYIYKGTVAAVADLPATGNTTGDVYNVTANDMNYAWDGSAWDPLGASFTITSITNAEIDTIVAS